MARVTLLVVATALAVFLLLPDIAFPQGLQLPCRFYGTVRLDSELAPDSIVITAVIERDTHIYTYSTTTPSIYGNSTYSLTISPPDGVFYSDGTGVSFIIGNDDAIETGTWEDGGNIELNINTSTSATPKPEQLYQKLSANSTAGGSVVNPGEGLFAYTFHPWRIVDLLAVPDDGYAFSNWTGDTDNISDVNDADTSISMCKQQMCGYHLCGICQDKSITANFIFLGTPTPTPTPTPAPIPTSGPTSPPFPTPVSESTDLSTGQITWISVLSVLGVLMIALLTYTVRRMSRQPRRRF